MSSDVPVSPLPSSRTRSFLSSQTLTDWGARKRPSGTIPTALPRTSSVSCAVLIHFLPPAPSSSSTSLGISDRSPSHESSHLPTPPHFSLPDPTPSTQSHNTHVLDRPVCCGLPCAAAQDMPAAQTRLLAGAYTLGRQAPTSPKHHRRPAVNARCSMCFHCPLCCCTGVASNQTRLCRRRTVPVPSPKPRTKPDCGSVVLSFAPLMCRVVPGSCRTGRQQPVPPAGGLPVRCGPAVAPHRAALHAAAGHGRGTDRHVTRAEALSAGGLEPHRGRHLPSLDCLPFRDGPTSPTHWVTWCC